LCYEPLGLVKEILFELVKEGLVKKYKHANTFTYHTYLQAAVWFVLLTSQGSFYLTLGKSFQ